LSLMSRDAPLSSREPVFTTEISPGTFERLVRPPGDLSVRHGPYRVRMHEVDQAKPPPDAAVDRRRSAGFRDHAARRPAGDRPPEPGRLARARLLPRRTAGRLRRRGDPPRRTASRRTVRRQRGRSARPDRDLTRGGHGPIELLAVSRRYALDAASRPAPGRLRAAPGTPPPTPRRGMAGRRAHRARPRRRTRRHLPAARRTACSHRARSRLDPHHRPVQHRQPQRLPRPARRSAPAPGAPRRPAPP
jgi:hypothetical protein